MQLYAIPVKGGLLVLLAVFCAWLITALMTGTAISQRGFDYPADCLLGVLGLLTIGGWVLIGSLLRSRGFREQQAQTTSDLQVNQNGC